MLRKEKNYILNGPLGMDGSIRENVGDIIEGGSGANLAEVTAAYAGLSSLYSDLSTAVPSLSNVSPIEGVDSSGKYKNKLQCITGGRGVDGLRGHCYFGISRAKNVIKQIIIAQNGSEEDFKRYMEQVDNLIGEEDFAELFNDGVFLGIINMIDQVIAELGVKGGWGMLIESLADIAYAYKKAVESGDYDSFWARIIANLAKPLAGAVNIGGRKGIVAFFSKIGLPPEVGEILVDIFITVGAGEGAEALMNKFKEHYGEVLFQGIIYSLVTNAMKIVVPGAGNFAGPIVANILSKYGQMPFLDENNEPSQAWLAAAGAATGTGGIAAAVAAAAASGPVGWAALGGGAMAYWLIYLVYAGVTGKYDDVEIDWTTIPTGV